MTLDHQTLIRLIWQSILQPASAARLLTGVDLPRGPLWMALALVTILSVLSMALIPGGAAMNPITGAPMTLTPWASALVLGALLVLMVFALHYTGQAMGGTGSFAATLILVAWLEAVAVVLRLAGLLVLAALGPGAAEVFSILALAALLWVLVNFVDVLHGFGSIGKSVGALLLALLGLGVGLSVILGAINAAVLGGL